MARFYQAEIGQEEGDQPKKKNKQGTSSNTPGDEAEFVHSLTPKQKAEYNSLDENQKAIVKYVFGVPGVDVSKIDLSGNKQKESTAVSAPPLPTRREAAHSGSGRSFAPDTGIGTKVLTESDGTKKKRVEESFLKETPGSEDRDTVFTHRSGSFASGVSNGGSRMNRNQTVNYLQGLRDEERRKSANHALVGALAAGIRGERNASIPEKKETVWQTYLKSVLRGAEDSVSGSADMQRTFFEPGQNNDSSVLEEYGGADQQISPFWNRFERDETEMAPNVNGFFERSTEKIGKFRDWISEKSEQLLSTHNKRLYDELLEVVEHPGETLDRTIKTNRAIDSEVKKMKNLIKDAHVDRHPKWSTYKFAEWQKDRIDNGSDQKSDDFKDEWISAYRDVIKTAADIYDIPPELLAGVAWIEVGGDPMWTDPVAYGARKIIPDIAWNILGLLPNEELQDKLGEINRDASKTSFGCVSMQLGVAANMLGIEPEDLNINTEKRLAEVLSDPKMSIMFAARHLAMLKNIDFPDIPAHELTDDDEVLIANRYNMGGDVPIEAIRQHYYGQRFMDRMDIIEKLLYPDEG